MQTKFIDQVQGGVAASKLLKQQVQSVSREAFTAASCAGDAPGRRF